MADETRAVTVERLVTRHHAEVYRYAYRLSGSQADAEDLTQQAFLVAQEKLDQLRSEDSARSWLFTVTRNCFLRTLRGHSAQSAAAMDLDLNQIPEETWDDPIDHERLQDALNRLAPEFRVILVMYYFEDCSYKEIAEKLNLPAGTVMSRLSRAKGHLRRYLSPHGTLSDGHQ
ncbi:MAG: RNA polymerase sigma factor [Pirellulales bacterium]